MEKSGMTEQKELEYFFCSIDGIGWQTLKQLFEQIPDRVRAYEMSDKQAVSALGEKKARLFLEKRSRADPHREWLKMKERGISFFSYWDSDYPEGLRRISDPPKAVYVKGKPPDSRERRVAVIGARACSSYGKRIAKQLGEQLAKNKISVVSGMARGIDGYSQQSAIMAGGISYGVLGCGVDICYPPENRELYEALIRHGGILSEYGPGTEARASLFPPRNRIISALAEIVVVVEAKVHSGTLITVDMALEQGKEVMAVPGRVGDALSEGCNRLIVQGATPVISAEQLLEELGIDSGAAENERKQAPDECLRLLTDLEKLVYGLLDEYPRPVDLIARELWNHRHVVDYGELCKTLFTLCRMGLAKQESNLCFVRLHR